MVTIKHHEGKDPAHACARHADARNYGTRSGNTQFRDRAREDGPFISARDAKWQPRIRASTERNSTASVGDDRRGRRNKRNARRGGGRDLKKKLKIRGACMSGCIEAEWSETRAVTFPLAVRSMSTFMQHECQHPFPVTACSTVSCPEKCDRDAAV